MTERYDEGVVKFDLAFRRSPALADDVLHELCAWRQILWQLQLIGQVPTRYGGVGFGNVSRRLPGDSLRFAISGTQTGALRNPGPGHFAIVTGCDPAHNRVEAEGPVEPSSESLSHGMLYRLDPAIEYIFHVHAPDIWQAREALDLPTTAAHVAYGTPAMAAEMARLVRSGAFAERQILVMGGHEDGVIAFGGTAEQAGLMVVRTLARALAP